MRGKPIVDPAATVPLAKLAPLRNLLRVSLDAADNPDPDRICPPCLRASPQTVVLTRPKVRSPDRAAKPSKDRVVIGQAVCTLGQRADRRCRDGATSSE